MAKQDVLICGNAQMHPEMNNPYLWSSHNWMVFEAGRMLLDKGFTSGSKVTVRGYSVYADCGTGGTKKVNFVGDEMKPEIK